MTLQLAMDMAGTFPILGYLLVKKVFKNQVSIQNYIRILRLSVVLYLFPFQQFKYLLLPGSLLERWNLNDFWGIAGKKISGFEVVNIPSLSGDYYVIPKRLFWIGVFWFTICVGLIAYHYGTYFFIKRKIKKAGMKTERIRRGRGRSIEVFQSVRVKTPCTVGWIRPTIFVPKKNYTANEKLWLIQHEMTHIRHGDVFWKCIAMICIAFHWYNPFVYYLFYQYSVMCEYYCDAECMRDRDIEEKKNYAIFLVRSAAPVVSRPRPALIQGLTNNGEKMQERVDRIIDEEHRTARKIRLLIAGIFTATCMCSLMTVFVYSAVPEQNVPAEDNTFTEKEWEYFYGGDITTGDEMLDFSKSALIFQTQDGQNIPVLQTDLINSHTKRPKEESQEVCSHVMKKGTLKIHAKGMRGGCHIEAYEAQRCEKCGIIKQSQQLYTSDYKSCSHNIGK